MATNFTSPLNTIRVASPCSADWDAMVGNNRERFCGECKLNVFNLSGMTKQEAENLIMNSEGKLCARFYQRKDGTIITKDCPVGWQAVKQRMTKVWTAVASIMITTVGSIGITNFMTQQTKPEIMDTIAIENTNPTKNNPYTEFEEINEKPELIMGDIAEPETDHGNAIMGRVAMPPK